MKITTPSNALVVVGLNEALQKRLVLPGPLTAGDVRRATQVQYGVGGKGQDVAIALHCLQMPAVVRLLQFVGLGAAGDMVQAQLLERGIIADKNDPLTIRTAAPLRTCTSLVAPDSTTELIEPSGAILPS